jgi:transcriptional regulator with XRE-family HTH domain
MNQIKNGSVGRQMRARRMQLQLTLTELAKRSGLSVPFLSQLEHGHSGVSLDSLQQLARGLEVGLDFFVHSPDGPCPVRSPRQFQHFLLSDHQTRFANAGSRDSECVLEALQVVLPAGCNEEGLEHQGEAFLVVLQGKLSLCIQGEEHLLHSGYTAHFKPGASYSWRNPSDSEVRLMWVGTPRVF